MRLPNRAAVPVAGTSRMRLATHNLSFMAFVSAEVKTKDCHREQSLEFFLFFIALSFLHKISSSLIVYIYPCICVQLYIEIYVYLYAIWLIALIGWKCLESVTVVESTLINAIPPVKSISMAFTYTCSYITYITRIYRHRQQSASKTTTKLRPCVSLWDIPRLDQATKLELKIIHHKQLPTKMRQSKLRQRLTLAASEEKSNQLKKKRIKYKYIYLYM